MKDEVQQQREINTMRVAKTSLRVRELEEELEIAQAKRDRVLIEAHGDPKTGGLSYNELAQASRLSRGRCIQIIQPVKTGKADPPDV